VIAGTNESFGFGDHVDTNGSCVALREGIVGRSTTSFQTIAVEMRTPDSAQCVNMMASLDMCSPLHWLDENDDLSLSRSQTAVVQLEVCAICCKFRKITLRRQDHQQVSTTSPGEYFASRSYQLGSLSGKKIPEHQRVSHK
jgi:hypothetical protein